MKIHTKDVFFEVYPIIHRDNLVIKDSLIFRVNRIVNFFSMLLILVYFFWEYNQNFFDSVKVVDNTLFLLFMMFLCLFLVLAVKYHDLKFVRVLSGFYIILSSLFVFLVSAAIIRNSKIISIHNFQYVLFITITFTTTFNILALFYLFYVRKQIENEIVCEEYEKFQRANQTSTE